MSGFDLIVALIIPFVVMIVAFVAAFAFHCIWMRNSDELNWQRVNSKRITYPPLKVVMDMVDYFDYTHGKRDNPLVNQLSNTINDAGYRLLTQLDGALPTPATHGDAEHVCLIDTASALTENDSDCDCDQVGGDTWNHSPDAPYVGDYPKIAFNLVAAGDNDGNITRSETSNNGGGSNVFRRLLGKRAADGNTTVDDTDGRDNIACPINDYYSSADETVSMSVVPEDGVDDNVVLVAEDGDYNETVNMTTASLVVLCHEVAHFLQIRDGDPRFVVGDVLDRFTRCIKVVALPVSLLLLAVGAAPSIVAVPAMLFLLLVVMRSALQCTYEKQASDIARVFLKSDVGRPWRQANGVAWILDCGYRTYVYKLTQYIALFVAVCCFAQVLDVFVTLL